MSPLTHFLTGWALAHTARLGKRGRALVTAAGVAPDIDGLGIVPELITRNSHHPLLWFSRYHHSLHTLAFALVVAAVALLVSHRSWITAGLALLSFHLHLLEDLAGSRGPDGDAWPIPYLKPFSPAWQLCWDRQWELNAWPNYVITIGLLCLTFWWAWESGSSPLEMFSPRLDQGFVRQLRRRFCKTSLP